MIQPKNKTEKNNYEQERTLKSPDRKAGSLPDRVEVAWKAPL